MKRSIVFTLLAAAAAAASAQSSVSISGDLKLAIVKGNNGTTPIEGTVGNASANAWKMNDLSSAITFAGKEDLGGGLHAGFTLTSFLHPDDGTTWGNNTFWSSRSTIQVGGSFGEVYLGRRLTPDQLQVLFSDPWYWDGSAAQVGWKVQEANYTSTQYLRTNNTVGYTSPSLGGLVIEVAGSPGEGEHSRDLGGSLTYTQGPIWAGVSYDQSHGFFNSTTLNHVWHLVGAYDFGVVRPLASFTESSVDGKTYKSYSLAVTAPAGPNGQVRAQYGHLDDADTATAGKQAYSKLSGGYTYSLSKRTSVFAYLTHAKQTDLTATNTVEFGVEHGF
jgi:predicted porin